MYSIIINQKEYIQQETWRLLNFLRIQNQIKFLSLIMMFTGCDRLKVEIMRVKIDKMEI